MNADLIAQIRTYIGDSKRGLPEEVFRLVSELTPLVNVDLLIKDSSGRTLLTWRDDEFYGPGWHIPGGILRFKERALDRLAKVAELELGAQISSNLVPLLITEIMHPSRDVRGHFISLLYECAITSGPLGECYSQNGQPKNGQWAWFSEAPSELIHQHKVYKPFIQNDC